MKKFHVNTSKIDTVFLVFLFMLFFATAGILVLLMARQYQVTVDSMNKNYEVRTVSSYLTQKVRSHDSINSVSVTELDGVNALALAESSGDGSYTTYIYYYDGALRELLIGTDSSFSLASGQSIASISAFSVELCREGVLFVTFTDSDGLTHEQYLAFATAGKEKA